jgi:hypothetical protein
VQQYLNMALNDSCTNVETRVLEARGGPHLVAKAGITDPWHEAPGASTAGPQAGTLGHGLIWLSNPRMTDRQTCAGS